MDMNNIVQIFKTVVENFNLVDGQNRGLCLNYHIFSGVTDSVVYNLEITVLATQEKVSLPCYILPEDDSKSQILIQVLWPDIALHAPTHLNVPNIPKTTTANEPK